MRGWKCRNVPYTGGRRRTGCWDEAPARALPLPLPPLTLPLPLGSARAATPANAACCCLWCASSGFVDDDDDGDSGVQHPHSRARGATARPVRRTGTSELDTLSVLTPESCEACERERLRVRDCAFPGADAWGKRGRRTRMWLSALPALARGASRKRYWLLEHAVSATTTGVAPSILPSLRDVLMSRDRCSASRTLQVGGRAVARDARRHDGHSRKIFAGEAEKKRNEETRASKMRVRVDMERRE